MQGNGCPAGAYVGPAGQIPSQHPNGTQPSHRSILPVTPAVGSATGPQFQNHQSSFRYVTSQAVVAAQLPDIERIQLNHQQQNSTLPSNLLQSAPSISNNSTTANNGFHHQHVRVNPYPPNQIVGNASVALRQLSQPMNQIQRPQFTNTSPQLSVQQQHAVGQHRTSRPSTPQSQPQHVNTQPPQRMIHQQSVPLVPPSSSGANDLIKKDMMLIDDNLSISNFHPQYSPPALQVFSQQGHLTHMQPSLNNTMQSNLVQGNLQQLNPNGQINQNMLRRPPTPQTGQSPSARPPTPSINPQSSRTPSPRPLVTPGILIPGAMAPEALSNTTSVLNRSNSPTNPSTENAQVQQSQRMAPTMNAIDPRFTVNPQQQLRPGNMTTIQMMAPSMIRPQQTPLGPHQQTFTPAQLEQLQRQQQIGMMPIMQTSAAGPLQMGGFLTGLGGVGQRYVGPGMHLTLGASLRTEGSFESREFAYTELSLRGLGPGSRLPGIGDQLIEILIGLTGMKPQIGIWKSECWRAVVTQEQLGTLSGKLIQSQSAFNQELWIKRYAEPAALKDFICLRMYSPEHLVVPSNFPCNARRVNEASASPQMLKLLSSLGFQPRKANNIYCSCSLFHYNVGTPENQLMIFIQKHFKDEAMTQDMFPGQLVVEVIGRVEEDSLIEPLSKRILDFCRHLQPFIQFHKF